MSSSAMSSITQILPCRHVGRNECSYESMFPYHNVYEHDDTPFINIQILCIRLPYELLVKIYNEYFRPHKFAQLYKSLTINSFCFPERLLNTYRMGFKKHLAIFLHDSIKKYISKIDPIFNDVITIVENRGFTSAFKLIPSVTSSIYLEIIMCKYH